MLPVATKDNMLNGQPFTQASLHTAFPGATGANEVSGGAPAYARKNITMAASSGGQRTQSASVTFDVPVSTVRWVGFWNAAAFVGTAPNGGQTPKNFMAVASSDTIYSTAHGWADTQKITFFQGTPPAPLVEGTVYFVRDSLTDSFKVATTSGGPAIDLTASASFGCVVCAITEDVYAAQGTHQLTTSTFTIPD